MDDESQPGPLVGFLEMSDPTGRSWDGLHEQPAPAVMLSGSSEPARPLSFDDQWFLSGTPDDIAPANTSGNRIDLRVQWLNTADRRWQTLWEQAYLPSAATRLIFRDSPKGRRVVLAVGER